MRWIQIVMLLGVTSGCSPGTSSRRPVPASPPSSSVRVGAGSADLHLVDVDGDGHLDLISRHLLQNRIVVTRGDGRGGFATATALTLESMPGAMDLGDLDGDGAPDLVVATRTGGHEVVDVFLGRRDGSFRRAAGAPVVVHESARTYKPIILLADVDEDAALDVVTANGRRGTVEILRGDGHGGLAPPRSVALASGEARSYLALGDVDGDGHLDLVASNVPESGPGRVLTRRGDGTGGFGGVETSATVLAGAALEALTDLDADGRPDLVLSHGDSALVSILMNRGDGTFAPAPGSPLDVGLPAFDAAVADVDADGHVDLVLATVDTAGAPDTSSRVVVLHGDGRTFTPTPASPYASGPGAFDVTTADVDADGRIDIAASSFGGDAVTLVLGRK